MTLENLLFETEMTAAGGREGRVSSPVTAKVGIRPIATGYAPAVDLRVARPGIDRALAQEIVAGAHRRCPSSNAIRGNVDVVLTAL